MFDGTLPERWDLVISIIKMNNKSVEFYKILELLILLTRKTYKFAVNRVTTESTTVLIQEHDETWFNLCNDLFHFKYRRQQSSAIGFWLDC